MKIKIWALCVVFFGSTAYASGDSRSGLPFFEKMRRPGPAGTTIVTLGLPNQGQLGQRGPLYRPGVGFPVINRSTPLAGLRAVIDELRKRIAVCEGALLIERNIAAREIQRLQNAANGEYYGRMAALAEVQRLQSAASRECQGRITEQEERVRLQQENSQLRTAHGQLRELLSATQSEVTRLTALVAQYQQREAQRAATKAFVQGINFTQVVAGRKTVT